MEFCYDQLEAGDFWDSSYLIDDPDALMIGKDEDWSTPCRQSVTCQASSGTGDDSEVFRESEGVVLRDRLMTDAALGGPKPIKAEHSYSLLACSSPPSSTRSCQIANRYNLQKSNKSPTCCGTSRSSSSSTTSTASNSSRSTSRDLYSHQQHRNHTHGHIDDMEEECYPAISMNTASGRDASDCAIITEDDSRTTINTTESSGPTTSILIKGEPLSPASKVQSDQMEEYEEEDELDEEDEDEEGKTKITAISPHSLHLSSVSDEEEDEITTTKVLMLREFKVEDDEEDEEDEEMPQQLIVTTSQLIAAQQELLPPTPPSSASSDSEGTVSASCSPERRDNNVQSLRGFLQPRLYVTGSANTGNNSQTGSSTRQPIHTPLISCQPKGSTGVLVLTEEEKRTLIAEGYPVPTRLPLSKQEEKSLKKVRRKIKNKISAQESRRKKKEYMDGLERRVTILSNENTSYKEKVSTLESTNRQLLKELQRLQALVQLQQSS